MNIRPANSPKRRRLIFALGVLALGATALFFALRSSRKQNPQLTAPTLAISSLAAKSLYFNGPARPWLLAQRPDLLTEDDRNERSDRSRGLVQAVQNPQLFRQLDRRYRFDTLLLVGDPSLYRPLLEHLLEAKDWTLTYLDHTSLVYRRAASREWQPADLDALKTNFPAPHDRALFLAQAAVKLLAIRRGADGNACLDQAQALDEKIPEVWNGLAIYRMSRGEWTPAMTNVDHALRLDADFLPAVATKTQILYSTKKFSAAYDLSTRLIEAYPDDPGLLFYHAKICHEAHAYTAEIRTLKRLIERADAETRPTTGYRLYLAQAYAADEQAQPSIEEFKRVLADQEISPAQRQFAEETLAQIKSRTGLR
jgi:tetratricopeptide (TPR) repeat protein